MRGEGREGRMGRQGTEKLAKRREVSGSGKHRLSPSTFTHWSNM